MAGASKSQRQFERPIRVLSASIDPGLNHARGLVLRHHGFEVTRSESIEPARELAEVFRAGNAQGKMIKILPSAWAAPKNRPDATVVGSDQLNELVAAVREGMV